MESKKIENKNKEEIQEKKRNKIRCNNCSSTFGYLRIKERLWICRSCGHTQKIEIEEEIING